MRKQQVEREFRCKTNQSLIKRNSSSMEDCKKRYTQCTVRVVNSGIGYNVIH